jgi:S1-C subfamily serine protease
MKDKKEKTENKEKSKFIKVKDPKKAGIMSFIIMLVVSALLIGSIVTIIFFDYLYAPNVETDQQKIEDDKIEVVVTEEESSVINVVKSVEKSVVSIAVNQLFFSTEQGIIDESNNIGTGFVVDKNGLIVTNQHVVSDIDADYVVVTSEGKEYEVADIERDDSNDIAILKVEATDLVPIPLGNSDAVVVGQTVIAIGTPLGKYMGSVTTGIISGLDRDVTASTGWFGSSAKTYEDVIQTDAAINPGNSGGPLLNTSGEVIGINFATTSGADNISFALPINVVKKRIEEYRTYGKFIKPYLGVSYQMISEYQAVYYENIVAGALIVRVDPYGPAQKAGIERGDIIIEFAGKKVDESLANIISQHEVGEEVELKVWNNEKERTIKVTLGEQE